MMLDYSIKSLERISVMNLRYLLLFSLLTSVGATGLIGCSHDETDEPSDEPSVVIAPSDEPTVVIEPSDEPTVVIEPSDEPTVVIEPSDEPTVVIEPSDEPTVVIEPSDPTPSPTSVASCRGIDEDLDDDDEDQNDTLSKAENLLGTSTPKNWDSYDKFIGSIEDDGDNDFFLFNVDSNDIDGETYSHLTITSSGGNAVPLTAIIEYIPVDSSDTRSFERILTSKPALAGGSLISERDMFFQYPGTYSLQVYDADESDFDNNEVFCYEINIEDSLDVEDVVVATSFPTSATDRSFTHSVTSEGKIGFYEITATEQNHQPIVINTTATPNPRDSRDDYVLPDVDTDLLVWSTFSNAIYAQNGNVLTDGSGSRATVINSNSSLGMFSLGVRGDSSDTSTAVKYLIIVDHYAINNHAEDTIETDVTVSLSYPDQAFTGRSASSELTAANPVSYFMLEASVGPGGITTPLSSGQELEIEVTYSDDRDSDKAKLIEVGIIDSARNFNEAIVIGTGSKNAGSFSTTTPFRSGTSMLRVSLPATNAGEDDAYGPFDIYTTRTATCPRILDTVTNTVGDYIALPTGSNDVLINEIYWGSTEDTNQSTVVHISADQFIEIINISAGTLDLSGVRVDINDKNRVIVPCGTTLETGKAITIFGAAYTDFQDGTTILTANVKEVDLDNRPIVCETTTVDIPEDKQIPYALCMTGTSNETVTIYESNGTDVLDQLVFSASANSSTNIDNTGTNTASLIRCQSTDSTTCDSSTSDSSIMRSHTTITGTGTTAANHSATTKVDGSAF